MADPHDDRSADNVEFLPGDDPPWGDDDGVFAMWASLDDEWAPMDFEALWQDSMERRPELWAERMRER